MGYLNCSIKRASSNSWHGSVSLIKYQPFVRKFIVAVFASCFLLSADGQSGYWQQQVHYTIDVSLNDKTHTLDGFERIEYINNSPDTLRFIWFHLWPNAYKNDKTAFSDQLLRNGRTDFYFSDQADKGYINRLDFKVNDVTAETQDHPEHIDIVKLMLPSPLPPSQKAIITTPFHVKLPRYFSRGGHDGQSYQATQWYPKPAVYDSKGWHPMPYLDQGEFYSEFGSFDVSITLPQNYVVAATGELQNEEEKEWLKTRASFEWKPQQKKTKTSGGQVKTITEKFPPSSASLKTVRFRQDRVHDFAWFADKRFVVVQDTCLLPSGKIITVGNYYYKKSVKNFWDNISYLKTAARFYSAHLGEYPYNTLSVVRGPDSPPGEISGMEYPTITLISAGEDFNAASNVVLHEIGHNWFYGILASNERDYPWMDEGMNSFYERKRYPYFTDDEKLLQALFYRFAQQKRDQPIATHSDRLTDLNYSTSVYFKGSEWMRYLESQVGESTFKEAMQEYYRRWQFKHPQPGDFKKVMEEMTGKDLDSTFALLDKKGLLPNQQEKRTRFISLVPRLSKGLLTLLTSTDNLYWISPALGYNAYDGTMLGLALSNYKLVPSRLQFFLAPMYGTRAKDFAGIGLVNYSAYPDGFFKRIDVGVSASKFSYNEFKKENGKYAYFGFEKFVPRLRLTFKEKDPRSTMNRYIQWKTYFFNEESYRVRFDSIINPGIDTTLTQVVRTLKESRTLNQLMIVFDNSRVLYPYSGELKIEQAKDFVRAAFTGKYYFNYAKEGGLDVRFFAGKFFYTTEKTNSKRFALDRYHLNLTGANGYEDYTYSDYFRGRNKFEGMESQQIMERDGAFKVRTDLLGDKVGKTDDWLIAVNFSSTIPSGLNPLSFLPIKIPLNFFVDIGTYADAWKRDANEDRFLFDAGLHIPLFKTINIYLPLIYSKVFKDYKLSSIPKKGRLWKMMSFSIDISNFHLRKIDRRLSSF